VDEDYAGLVHSDACPDNTHLSGGVCRFFDYELAGWGPVALDAVYLLAPFPSCWCFAPLPADVASGALAAYRSVLEATAIPVSMEFDAQLARALGFFVVARARRLPELGARCGPESEPDENWGTTTLRPRLLTWLRRFTGFPASADVLPRLHALAVALESALADRWGPVGIPSYPALAQPGDPVPEVPAAWLEA
jgi:Ser/Thr protein kinase RdoA (MazF antagonist)